jgi:isopenicillin N synthase-like dioxygenase|tara:strand:+ start:106 stop:1074 length:969 start_codon:yes stop_codon:yes gene_type:complete
MKSYIPTINISSLLNKNLESVAAKKTIKKIETSCLEIGFFQITGHGINKKDINDVVKVANSFFNTSIKNKMKIAPKKWNKLNQNIYRGYFPSDVNGKEGLDIGDLKVTKKDALKLNNQYIEYIELYKSINKKSIKILENYYDQNFNLGEILFKSIIKIYNKNTDIFKLAFSRLKTLSTLRFNCYPNQVEPVEISKQDGVALGCETHVDSGVFTILYQDRKGGLQVQNKITKKWLNVPFNDNALIVNTGLALQFLSKGKFKATNHRVLWNKTKRISIPFFFEPSYDFKMNYSFLDKTSKNKDNNIIFEKFLDKSLKKFIEYKR